MTTRITAWGVGLNLLLSVGATADEVYLRGGGHVSGVIVERTSHVVVLETGPGRVSVPLSRVERIEDGRSALESYQEQARSLDPLDVAGWARLARWAEDHDLATVARETWQRVLWLDPSHPEANAALGRLAVDGEWMDEAEAHRRLGHVQYQGRWVTPAEHEALVRERQAERQDARERVEAELRVREAEARAREAEARAREAEAYADADQGVTNGIPYDWVIYGSGAGYVSPGLRPDRPHRPPGQGDKGNVDHRQPRQGRSDRPHPPTTTPAPPRGDTPPRTAPRSMRGAVQVPRGPSRQD